jgi:peptidase E
MPARQPTIIATSISFLRSQGGFWEGIAGPSYEHAIKLAQVSSGRRPRLCFLATGLGDNPVYTSAFYYAFNNLGVEATSLSLFPSPSFPNMREHLLSQDIIWVSGGSTANLLAVWRVHGLDDVMRECWEAGVVLMGSSAGAICWHSGGTTDSFRLPLQGFTDGLKFLPYANSPHYSTEKERRPLTNQLVADGVIPDAYATDDHAGLVFFGTELHEAIAERPGAKCYSIARVGEGKAVETELPTRLL